jgi:hypothetical protein
MGHKNRPLVIFCHVVYATLGFTQLRKDKADEERTFAVLRKVDFKKIYLSRL